MRLHHLKDEEVVVLHHPVADETTLEGGELRDQRGFDLHRRLGGQPEPLELVEICSRDVAGANDEVSE
jgi:hypothetical protein